LKEEALDRTMWRHRFGGGFGPVVRQNTEWMNECHSQVSLMLSTDINITETTYPCQFLYVFGNQ